MSSSGLTGEISVDISNLVLVSIYNLHDKKKKKKIETLMTTESGVSFYDYQYWMKVICWFQGFIKTIA